MRCRLATVRVALIAQILLWLSPVVQAQQEFTLGDDDNWQQSRAADPTSPEGRLAEAKQLLAGGDADRARTITDAWIKEHERHPLLPEAYLIRGDAKTALGDEYEALYDYEFIARMYPGSEAFVTALRRELEIARQYGKGMKRKLWGIRMAGAEDEAEEIFIRIQERMPGSRIGEDAGMELADFYFDRRKMALAADAYSLFVENYPDSPLVDKARRRLIYAHLASFKGPQFDAAGLNEARTKLEDLKRIRPVEAQKVGADALISRIDESNAAKMLSTAQWYDRIGDPIACELTIRRLIKKYPRSAATADALRFVPEVLKDLPPRVIEQAPDYATLRATILGVTEEPAKTAAAEVCQP